VEIKRGRTEEFLIFAFFPSFARNAEKSQLKKTGNSLRGKVRAITGLRKLTQCARSLIKSAAN